MNSSTNILMAQNYLLEGYQVPKTLLNVDLLSRADDQQKKKAKIKGFSFEKMGKTRKLIISQTPSPSHYFQMLQEKKSNNRQIQNRKSKNTSKSPFSKQLPKIPKVKIVNNHLTKLRVNYQYHQNNFFIEKAEKVGYIDEAMRASSEIPGPGSYTIERSTQKSLNSQKRFRTQPKNNNKKNKKNRIQSKVGPGSYNIGRSRSVTCGVNLRPISRDHDTKFQQRLKKFKEQKENQIKTAPGKYLKLDQWACYKNGKKVLNSLTICSRPNYLKIYY